MIFDVEVFKCEEYVGAFWLYQCVVTTQVVVIVIGVVWCHDGS